MKKLLLLSALFVSFGSFGQTAEEYFSSALEKFKKEDLNGAIEDYSKVIELKPEFSEAYIYRANTVFELTADFNKVIKDYNKAIELDSNNGYAFFSRAVAYSRKGDNYLAKLDFNKAIELRPNEGNYFRYRAYTKLSLNEYNGACTDIRKSIQLGIADKDIYQLIEQSCGQVDEMDYFYVAGIRTSQDDYESAILDYSKAIDINPRFARAYSKRGILRGFASTRGFNKYNPNDIIDDISEGIKLGDITSWNYENRAVFYATLGKFSDALSDLNKAIELESENYRYHRSYQLRGKVKFEKGDYNGAISDYTKAIEINPNYVDAYFNRGISKAELKDYSGAISDYNKAIELDPNDATAYNNRAASKYFANDLKGACEDAKKSASLGYDASKLIQDFCN